MRPNRTAVTDPPAPLDGLWLFDGVCNFCSGSVRLALRLDRKGVLRFTPLQSPFGQAIAARYGLDLENPDSFLYFDQGRPLAASDAVIALAGRLGAPWSWAAAFRVIPKGWRDAAYLVLARNRYRLMGKRRTCMVPTPGQRARFITEPPSGWAAHWSPGADPEGDAPAAPRASPSAPHALACSRQPTEDPCSR